MNTFTLFGFIIALLAEIYIIGVTIKTKYGIMYIISTIQTLNVIWQFTRVLGLLP